MMVGVLTSHRYIMRPDGPPREQPSVAQLCRIILSSAFYNHMSSVKVVPVLGCVLRLVVEGKPDDVIVMTGELASMLPSHWVVEVLNDV